MTRYAVLAVLAALLVGGSVGTAASTTGPTLKVAYNKKLKAKIIVDGKGLTLYMFKGDGNGAATCTDKIFPGCTKEWPPLIDSGTTEALAPLDASLLGTATRDDGKVQVTYNGHALYYFRGDGTTPPDRKPGQIYGQNYVLLWWVLGANGKPIKKRV